MIGCGGTEGEADLICVCVNTDWALIQCIDDFVAAIQEDAMQEAHTATTKRNLTLDTELCCWL